MTGGNTIKIILKSNESSFKKVKIILNAGEKRQEESQINFKVMTHCEASFVPTALFWIHKHDF